METLLEKEFKDHKLLILAPYGPMFNLIEHIWSVVKADLKRNMAENMADMLDNELCGSLTFIEYVFNFC